MAKKSTAARSPAKKRPAAKSGGPGTGTVERAIHIMRYFATNPEVTIKELSTALHMSPSTCHRLLDLLAAEGIVEHVKSRRSYQIGMEYGRLAAQVQARNTYQKMARPLLREMVNYYNETCVFSLYIAASRSLIFAEKAESSRPLRYQVPLNEPMRVFWGATGRAVYANLPDDERRAIYDTEGPAPGSGEPLPTWNEIEAEVKKIRAQGFVMTRGQKTPGSVGISAPVFNAENNVIGSVGFTIPQSQVGAYDVDDMGRYVARKAVELSTIFGATLGHSTAAE